MTLKRLIYCSHICVHPIIKSVKKPGYGQVFYLPSAGESLAHIFQLGPGKMQMLALSLIFYWVDQHMSQKAARIPALLSRKI